MTNLFVKLVNMSINAGWLIIAVIILRLILARAPKWTHCLMWCIVGLRLIFPFSIQSILSVLPSAEVIPNGIELSSAPALNSGISIIDNAVNPIIHSSLAPDYSSSANPLQIYLFIAAIIWLTGIAFMLLYCAISYLRLRAKVNACVLYSDNVYYCDNIDTPFILGIIKPKIYLPSDIDAQNTPLVIKHEQAHIKRFDHITKLIGYLLLSVYWFNPLIWLGYSLLCRDIEKACDQKAIKNMDNVLLKAYASALLSCSIKRLGVAACPLAFGEIGVKSRIKALINYKKPAFWIIIIAIILCVSTAICFLTDPVAKEPPYNKNVGSVTVIENSPSNNGLSIRLVEAVLDGDKPYFDIEWINNSSNEQGFGEAFDIYRKEKGKMVRCATEDLFFHEIAHILNPHSTSKERYYLNAFDLSKEGIYRFVIEDFENRNLWVDFEIKNTTQANVGGVDSSDVSVIYTPPYINGIYSLSRNTFTADFTLYKTFNGNVTKLMSFLANNDYTVCGEGNWVKFNPATPNNHCIVAELYDGSCQIINIHFSQNTDKYSIALATFEGKFDINNDYSRLEYTRCIASKEFGEFLSDMLDWSILKNISKPTQ